MDTYVKAASLLSYKRPFPQHSLTPLHPMTVNIPTPRLRLSLSRNSLVSIGAVSPTNITSFGRNDSHDPATEQLSQDPFTNDHDKFQVDQDAPHPCSITPAPKAPHTYTTLHPDVPLRVAPGCHHPSKYTLQGGSDTSESSIGDSDTYVVGYTESDGEYDAVLPNEDSDSTSFMAQHSRPSTSQSFTSDWIRDRFEMVSPESCSSPNTSQERDADAPESDESSLRFVDNEDLAYSDIDPATTATVQSFSAAVHDTSEHDTLSMSFEGTLRNSAADPAFSTTELTSVEEPDVTVSVTFNPSDLVGQHPSFHSHISSARHLSIRTDTRVENATREHSDSLTFPRRLSRLVSRRVNAVLGAGRHPESHIAAPVAPDPLTRRRRYTLSIEVEVDVPSDEHRPPTLTDFNGSLLRSSDLTPTIPDIPEPPSSTVHVERERNSLERFLHRVRRKPVAAASISIDNMSEREREHLKAQMRRYST